MSSTDPDSVRAITTDLVDASYGKDAFHHDPPLRTSAQRGRRCHLLLASKLLVHHRLQAFAKGSTWSICGTFLRRTWSSCPVSPQRALKQHRAPSTAFLKSTCRWSTTGSIVR